MNALFTFLCLFWFSSIGFSQSNKSRDFWQEVSFLEVDTSIFDLNQGIFFANSKSRDVFMICMLVHQDFEQSVASTALNDRFALNPNSVQSKDTTINGLRIYCQEGTIVNEEGEFYLHGYIIERKKQEIIFLMCCSKDDRNEHLRAFELSFTSLVGQRKKTK